MNDLNANNTNMISETDQRPVSRAEFLLRFRPAPSLGAKASARYKRKLQNAISTDLIAWLRENDPADFAELMDLRRAMYSLSSKGKYRVFLLGLTQYGERKIKLVGPKSAVMIVSEKSRHYLLRVLCRLRKARGWPPIRY
ncbi:hypothetical protein [Bradyrhizobium guangxiense]|uniref:hypothetical protein n=1 Tax=Bradyrhizobium guangxiense TaxID=1325115 RepID=UPI001008F57C|nr:hypothetical protein [Bradyrhizobium guangxiense]